MAATPAQKVAFTLLKAYKLLLSPLLGQRCRFYPSCSSYMYEAISQHGVVQGIWLGTRRLLKCHRWHPGGVDLVPPNLDIMENKNEPRKT